MRKKFAALTAGVIGAIMIAGCGGQTAQNSTTAAETGTTAETKTTADSETSKEEKAETSKAEETKTEAGESETGTEEVVDLFAPIRIWGDVTEVTDRAIYVDNQSDNSSLGEIILTIDPETTRILDGANGYPVDLKDIEKGHFEAYLGAAMTMSLPPQSTPYVVIVNIPDDVEAPRYVVASKEIQETDGTKVLTGNDKTEYVLGEEVTIIPYLTKQLVRLEDIKEGSECLVWLGDGDVVEHIVLFQE